MPVVQETVRDAANRVARDVQIDILLVASADADGNAPGYATAPTTILGRWRTWTGADGTWSADLLANSAIVPANTYYTLSRQGAGVRSDEVLIVPNGAGPYWVNEVLTVPPTALPTFLSDSLALALATTAQAGTGSKVSRADHVHPSTGLEVLSLVTVTADYAVLVTDKVVLANNAGALTATLPSASSVQVGQQFLLKKISNNAALVTVTASSGTIDGQTSVLLRERWDLVRLVSDGANYHVVGSNLPVAFRVRDYGAKGDGTTDDTAAIDACQTAAIAFGAAQIELGAGTYLLSGSGVQLRRANMRWLGAGSQVTTLKLIASSGNPMMQSTGTPGSGVVVEHIGFDGTNSTSTLVSLVGTQLTAATFRHCRFKTTAGACLAINGFRNLLVQDCEFYSDGLGDGTGINITNGAGDLDILNNTFRWLENGIIVDTGNAAVANEELAERIRIRGNLFDLGWWMLPALFTNAADTSHTTYTATTLTDTVAAFTGLGASNALLNNIRVLTVAHTGTFTSTPDQMQTTDSGALFTTYSLIPGEIIRSGTKWSYISAVQADTILRTEGWLDTTTNQPVLPPANGAAYTVYKLALGRSYNGSVAPTGTVITTDRWHDLNGTGVTPANGSLYEVARNRCNYALNIEGTARDILVESNTFLRGWSDQCSVFCNRARILGNTIKHGQDMGITLNHFGDDGRSIVANNSIEHQGAGGLYTTCNDAVIQGNQFFGITPWQNANVSGQLAHLQIYNVSLGGASGGQRNLVVNNQINLEAAPHGTHGISLLAGAANNVLRDNQVRGGLGGTFVSDILCDGAGTAGNRIIGEHSITYANSAVAGVVELLGTGTPEGAVAGAPGSTFKNRSGGVGTSWYVKEANTTVNGWVGK